MKIPGAVVIAETLPAVENIVLRSARDGSEVRKSAKPFIIIRDHGGDLGMPEHELGYNDRVRIAGFAPTSIAAMAARPAQQRGSDRANAVWIVRSAKPTIQGRTLTCNLS